jgi:hypothetical protein
MSISPSLIRQVGRTKEQPARPAKYSEAGVMPEEKLMTEIVKHHEKPGKTGAQLDASRLRPRSEGTRMKYSGGRRTVIDGPFAETKEVMGGHMVTQAK